MEEPIAVVGSSCRFPGGASSPAKLWQLLQQPRDVLRDFPKDRLNLAAFYNENGEYHGSTDVINKGYLLDDDPRAFDASFFNVSPLEADYIDPQQRLILEVAYECIESACYTLDQISGSRTAVFLGVMTDDFRAIQQRDLEAANRYHGTGSALSILSNRISYFLNLHGPSLTLDTACSSSLAALHLGVQSLRSGESTGAIIAGVNLIFDCASYITESKLHMLSPESRSRMWDEKANGYARGEGASCILIKTLSQALKDGDHIECIVRETGMSSDGRTPGITMPSTTAQSTLIRETYQKAGLDPENDRPQFFECHGTGTQAGDPVEAQAVCDAFFPAKSPSKHPLQSIGHIDDHPLYCGSVKTVIGHLEGCAGLAGLLKASLAVQHGFIPPNLLFEKLNPAIEPFYQHLEVPTALIPWPDAKQRLSPRRVSLNSFGFGGTNVHAIIEQYEPEHSIVSLPTPTRSSDSRMNSHFVGPLVISAERESSVVSSIRRFADTIRGNPELDLEALASLTQTSRTLFSWRVFFSGESRLRLLDFLDAAAETGSGVAFRAPSTLVVPGTPGVLGIFSGQGAQWPRMGRFMIERCAAYRASIQKCEEALRDIKDAPTWSLMEELLLDDEASHVHEAAISQPLCTATQIAMVDTLRHAGVKFRAVVGHSSGEITATYAAGILSACDAMRISYYRGLHAKLAGTFRHGVRYTNGLMMAIGLGHDEAIEFCKQFSGLQLAASNSPTSSTISGDADVVLAAQQVANEENIFTRLLKVDTAYHSHHMQPCVGPYLDSLATCGIRIHAPDPGCIWISFVYGHAELLDNEKDLQALKGQYWVDNMVRPVLFHDAIECSLWRAGPFDLAVEVGAHPALKGPATQSIKTALGTILPYATLLRRGYNDMEAFAGGIGYLWAYLGAAVDFAGWREGCTGEKTSEQPLKLKNVPSYSWGHEKIHWKEARVSRRFRLEGRRPHELLGRRAGDDSDQEMRWRNMLKVEELPWIRGHVFQGQILFPAAGYVCMALQAAMELANGRPVRLIDVRDLTIPRALTLEENHPTGIECISTLRVFSIDPVADGVLTADFACYSASSDTHGDLEQNCSGQLTIELETGTKTKENDVLPLRLPARSGMAPVDVESYYDALQRVGLDYQGLFRGIKDAERTMGYARTKAAWQASEVGSAYVMHPGPLDVAFHSIFVAFSNPWSETLRSPYLPVRIGRLTIRPDMVYTRDAGDVMEFDVDSYITKTTGSTFEGDIHIAGPDGRTGLQAEGITLKLFTEARSVDDRPMFSKTIWKRELLAGKKNLDVIVPSQEDLDLAEAIERTALFFLQETFAPIQQAAVAEWAWHHQAFYRAAKHSLELVAQGCHPTAEREWLDDSRKRIDGYRQRFPDQADLNIIHAIAPELLDVMASEQSMLEVMMRDDMLSDFYTSSRALFPLNNIVAELMSEISHQHPRSSILEVGAGTGGTTASILSAIGDAFGHYTYTDISAGFFDGARHRFAAQGPRLTYQTLDVERSPEEQGFQENTYDIVVCPNVLHATHSLERTTQHVRRLLKPGGYLILVEVTGEMLNTMFIMGGLPGWWHGVEEGRFSGVEKFASDLPHEAKHACSVIVSQAVDERVALLQQPLSKSNAVPRQGRVIILDGPKEHSLESTTKGIAGLVSNFVDDVQIVNGLDAIDIEENLSAATAVIALCDVVRPIFADLLTDQRLQKLQALYSCATNVLWITSGRLDDEPFANMMVGLGRALTLELPQLNLQFLDIDMTDAVGINQTFVAETFARLCISPILESSGSPLLWSSEPELRLIGDEVHIPRIVRDVEKNNRFNAEARDILVDRSPAAGPIAVIRNEKGISFEQVKSDLRSNAKRQTHGSSKEVLLKVEHSITLPLSESAVLVVGHLDSSGVTALAVVESHATEVRISQDRILTQCAALSSDRLRMVADQLVAAHVLSLVATQAKDAKVIIVYGASPPVAHALRHVALDKRLIFASPLDGGCMLPGFENISVHPRSTLHSIRASIPKHVEFVVNLAGSSDPIAVALLKLFPGIDANADALGVSGVNKQRLNAACNSVAQREDYHADESAIVPAQKLYHAPILTLDYPTIVDWSAPDVLFPTTVRPIRAQNLFSADRTYFMVGLVSRLGRSLCRWMVENGARYMALASRTGEVEPIWLQEMANLNAVVHVYQMNVAEKASVQAVCRTIRAEMPPVAGVANGALVLRDGLFMDMDRSAFTDVTVAKVDGSMHLHHEFQQPDLDFFVLFSSMSAHIGNAGQSNYNAAGLFQAALASQRRKNGLAASVMSLGMVTDVGYVADRGPDLIRRMKRLFYMPISERDVHMIFAEAIAASRPGANNDDYPTIETLSGLPPFEYDASTQVRPPWISNPRMSHYVRERATVEASADNTHAGGGPLGSQLEAAGSEHELAQVLVSALDAKLESIFQMSGGTLNADTPLLDLGVDSLLAVEVRTWFLKEVHVDVPVLKILGGGNSHDIAAVAAVEVSSWEGTARCG